MTSTKNHFQTLALSRSGRRIAQFKNFTYQHTDILTMCEETNNVPDSDSEINLLCTEPDGFLSMSDDQDSETREENVPNYQPKKVCYKTNKQRSQLLLPAKTTPSLSAPSSTAPSPHPSPANSLTFIGGHNSNLYQASTPNRCVNKRPTTLPETPTRFAPPNSPLQSVQKVYSNVNPYVNYLLNVWNGQSFNSPSVQVSIDQQRNIQNRASMDHPASVQSLGLVNEQHLESINQQRNMPSPASMDEQRNMQNLALIQQQRNIQSPADQQRGIQSLTSIQQQQNIQSPAFIQQQGNVQSPADQQRNIRSLSLVEEQGNLLIPASMDEHIEQRSIQSPASLHQQQHIQSPTSVDQQRHILSPASIDHQRSPAFSGSTSLSLVFQGFDPNNNSHSSSYSDLVIEDVDSQDHVVPDFDQSDSLDDNELRILLSCTNGDHMVPVFLEE